MASSSSTSKKRPRADEASASLSDSLGAGDMRKLVVASRTQTGAPRHLLENNSFGKVRTQVSVARLFIRVFFPQSMPEDKQGSQDLADIAECWPPENN